MAPSNKKAKRDKKPDEKPDDSFEFRFLEHQGCTMDQDDPMELDEGPSKKDLATLVKEGKEQELGSAFREARFRSIHEWVDGVQDPTEPGDGQQESSTSRQAGPRERGSPNAMSSPRPVSKRRRSPSVSEFEAMIGSPPGRGPPYGYRDPDLELEAVLESLPASGRPYEWVDKESER